DYIFLLSLEEVVKYFGDSGQLSSRPSGAYFIRDEYDKARMVSPWSGWWLRSTGDERLRAAFVHETGEIFVGGSEVYHNEWGVRPAMWITL
ncbi:MAG: DUF6273 domain-containing protein, partial [Oscillospiraceae bacterium]|nr:DUF6273 domain-containing protein [Oscillospiraceae bacterium]